MAPIGKNVFPEKLNMISSHEPVCTNAATMQQTILPCKIIKIYNDHHVCRRSRWWFTCRSSLHTVLSDRYRRRAISFKSAGSFKRRGVMIIHLPKNAFTREACEATMVRRCCACLNNFSAVTTLFFMSSWYCRLPSSCSFATAPAASWSCFPAASPSMQMTSSSSSSSSSRATIVCPLPPPPSTIHIFWEKTT